MIEVWSCAAGRPDRGRSPSTARPPPAFRARHAATVARLTPTRQLTPALDAPPAADSKFRALAPPAHDRVQSHSAASPARITNRCLRPAAVRTGTQCWSAVLGYGYHPGRRISAARLLSLMWRSTGTWTSRGGPSWPAIRSASMPRQHRAMSALSGPMVVSVGVL